MEWKSHVWFNQNKLIMNTISFIKPKIDFLKTILYLIYEENVTSKLFSKMPL